MAEETLWATLSVSDYVFQPIAKFGNTDNIQFVDQCLFLEPSVKPQNDNYNFWQRFCKSYRHAYIIAEGVIKKEALDRAYQKKAKVLGKTVEEIKSVRLTAKGFKKYSVGCPKKIYGFFRVAEEADGK